MQNEHVQNEVKEVVYPQFVTEDRKLVTIRTVSEIKEIPGADNIVSAVVDGWEVVVKKGEFKDGDMCMFFEIDSFLPANDSRYEFLLKSGVKTDEHGVERLRVRSIKLRQFLSQGLALPIGLFPEISTMNIDELERLGYGIEQFINVTKYIRPSERENNGGGKNASCGGDFPHFIPKTDEPRAQNIFGKYQEKYKELRFRKSLKLDGSSTTIAYIQNENYRYDKLDNVKRTYNPETQECTIEVVGMYPFQDDHGQLLLCSRNNTLKYEENNHFWIGVESADIPKKLKDYCVEYDLELAIQGETIGPRIQGNPESLDAPEFFAFRIWDIKNQRFLNDYDFISTCEALQIQTAPQFEIEQPFMKYNTIKEILDSADIPSLNAKIAEGVVYKSVEEVDGETIHFKVINNKWLLKVEE